MYQWFEKYRDILVDSAGLSEPATEDELKVLESSLGFQLSPSHRAFLLRSNGAEDWGVYGTIYSTERLLKEFHEWGFSAWKGQLKVLDPDFDESHYHSQRPSHFLMVAQHPLGADCHCLDTYSQGQQEFYVCKYDAEYDLEDNIRPIFVDFEAFLLAELGNVFESIEDEDVLENEALWSELERYMEQARVRNQTFLESLR